MSHLSQRPAGEPSRTQTVTSNEEPPAPQLARLRLRGAPPASRRRVVWDDDVVDNEGQGRKSSKSQCTGKSQAFLDRAETIPCVVCCIYTKPRAFDESSSESSSSGSDSESDPSDHDKRPPLDPSFKDGKGKGKQKIRSGGERDAGAASESSSGSESEGGVGDGGAR